MNQPLSHRLLKIKPWVRGQGWLTRLKGQAKNSHLWWRFTLTTSLSIIFKHQTLQHVAPMKRAWALHNFINKWERINMWWVSLSTPRTPSAKHVNAQQARVHHKRNVVPFSPVNPGQFLNFTLFFQARFNVIKYLLRSFQSVRHCSYRSCRLVDKDSAKLTIDNQNLEFEGHSASIDIQTIQECTKQGFGCSKTNDALTMLRLVTLF